MKRDLIAELRCPYCNGAFEVVSPRNAAPTIEYGLIECRCFQFPIVGGVLLLSLAKGYGIPEDEVLPYAPLQVASIKYLLNNDIAGLLAWMGEHAPVARALLDGEIDSYLAGAALLHDANAASNQRFLADQARYGVVGVPDTRRRWQRFRGPAPPPPVAETELVDQRREFYVSRFISPRVNSLALMLASLRSPGRLLSLCCGHGVLENIVAATNEGTEVVSVDAQLPNLLLARRFVHPKGSFICHDLQFPLPFRDSSFDAVASSTCLPEIPPQAPVVGEAVRVTDPTGWTLFDSIWNADLGARRVDPARPYRYCQNFFADLADYVPFFDECAGLDREVAIDVAKTPAAYTGGSTWTFGDERTSTIAERADAVISVLVVGRGHRPVVDGQTAWLTPERLSVSPAYSVRAVPAGLVLELLPQFARTYPEFAPAGFPGYRPTVEIDLARLEGSELLELFVAGALAILPDRFSSDHRTLAAHAAAQGRG